MIDSEQVIQWLKDGGQKEAASLLSQCVMTYEWVDILFEMSGNREYNLLDVKIEAPHKIISEIETTLVSQTEQIEKAVQDCMKTVDCVVRSIDWVPKLADSAPELESDHTRESLLDSALGSWSKDLDEMLDDSTVDSYNKASQYIDWYFRVEEQLGEFGVLGNEGETACERLWRSAAPSGFPRDYEYGSSIHSLIRAAQTALHAIKDHFRGIEPVIGELFPLDIVSKAKGFVQDVAYQANGCYEKGWYDASAVMVRRLIEILIIDCFDVYGSLDEIKDNDGNIFPLSRLVEKFLEEPNGLWHVERGAKPAIRKLKNICDAAAHGRYRKTLRQSLDRYKESLEIAIQQLVGIVERGGSSPASK